MSEVFDFAEQLRLNINRGDRQAALDVFPVPSSFERPDQWLVVMAVMIGEMVVFIGEQDLGHIVKQSEPDTEQLFDYFDDFGRSDELFSRIMSTIVSDPDRVIGAISTLVEASITVACYGNEEEQESMKPHQQNTSPNSVARELEEELETLAEMYGSGNITKSEWMAARKSVQARLDSVNEQNQSSHQATNGAGAGTKRDHERAAPLAQQPASQPTAEQILAEKKERLKRLDPEHLMLAVFAPLLAGYKESWYVQWVDRDEPGMDERRLGQIFDGAKSHVDFVRGGGMRKYKRPRRGPALEDYENQVRDVMKEMFAIQNAGGWQLFDETWTPGFAD
jgi:hypothetical protein